MNHRSMTSRYVARNWEEAFPGGNGRIGVLAMGNPFDETIIVNHERLFLPMEGRVKIPDMAGHLPEIREMIRQGRFRDAAEFFILRSTDQGLPADLSPDYYHPAFDIRLTMENESVTDEYLRTLDFETGEITTTWKNSIGVFHRKLFVSRTDHVIVISIHGDIIPLPRCRVRLAERETSTPEESRVAREYLGHITTNAEDQWITYSVPYRRTCGGYLGIARVMAKGGYMATENGSFMITGAEEINIHILFEFRTLKNQQK